MPGFDAIRFFRESDELVITRNRLPHWQQEGGTIFITFRLADSLPHELLKRFQNERKHWLSFHPEPWSDETEREYHRKFSLKIDGWLDAGHGTCVLSQPEVSQVLEQAIRHFDGDRYLIHSAVVMPNHVHVLCSLRHGAELGAVVSSWKSFSARRINALLEQDGALWQRDYFDRLIRGERHLAKVARYIRANRASVPTAQHFEADWLTTWLDH